METTTFLRDQNSKALLNTDIRGVAAYKARREKSKQLQVLEEQINTVRNDLSEIKILLQSLLTRD